MLIFASDEIHDDVVIKIVGPVAAATVTAFVSLIIWWLNRKKPNRIEVREVELISLLKVADTIRHRITATLDGQTIEQLSQIEVSLMNKSVETIREIAIQLSFPSNTCVLDCELNGIQASRTLDTTTSLTIHIPFLNSYYHHGDKLTAKILCNGLAHDFTVRGRGEAWSAHRVSLDSIIRFQFRLAFVLMTITAAITLAIGRLARELLEVPSDEFSWRLLAVQLPLFALMALVEFLILRSLRRATNQFRF